MTIIIDFRLFFQKNSGLPLYTDTTQIAFNSVFVKSLYQKLSLLKDQHRMGNHTTSDLVNLANQLAHTLNGSSKRKNAKIFNFQFQQRKVPI